MPLYSRILRLRREEKRGQNQRARSNIYTTTEVGPRCNLFPDPYDPLDIPLCSIIGCSGQLY
jgi:hypothetical protein